MSLPFLDLTRQHKEVADDVFDALRRVLDSGELILGSEVAAFESEWARFCSMPGAAAVANGTDALALALIASGAVRRNRGDEVITSPLTAGYTALAIMNAGGVPVFADIDPETYTLDPEAIRQAITPRTRAIVPVHIYGQMADMNAICDVAAHYGLHVIEDAAQAHGTSAGTSSQAAAFSFYPTKNLGAYGDGGAVVSTDAALIERVKILRQGGHASAMSGKDEGRNSRLDEVQAAILRVKLPRLEEWNQQRRMLAEVYHEALKSLPHLQRPLARINGEHAYHLYVVQRPARDRLRVHLAAHGIETLIHYPFLLHQQPLFRQHGQCPLPVAEQTIKRVLSLPLYPQLTIKEVRFVADAVCGFPAHQLQAHARV